MEKHSRVYLRAFEMDDHPTLNRWRNNDEIFRLTSGNKFFISSEWDKKWVEDKICNNEKNIYLGICLEKYDDLIGYLSLNKIDHRNRTASWGDLVIGEKDLWNKGYGTEAAQLMVRFAFEELWLICLYGVFIKEHAATLKKFERVGFVREETLRKRVYKNNRHHDQVMMSILREEYMRVKKEK